MTIFGKFCCFVLLISCTSVHSESIRIVTEDYPPYNYLDNGELKGLSVEVIRAVMERTQIEYTIEVMPWARAMITTENSKNVFVFSMRKIESRENRFIWIGSICSSPHSIFSLQNRQDIKIDSIDDLKSYRIGTTIHDSRETIMIDMGIPIEKLTRISGHDAYERNYMKLKYGRIDVWPMDDVVAFYIAKDFGDEPRNILRKIFSFESGVNAPYYLATNLMSDVVLIDEISRALDEFKKTDDYFSLLARWNAQP